MPGWLILLLVVLIVGGLIFKALRLFVLGILAFLGLELLLIILYPRTLVWLAEIALRVKGVTHAF